jgi:hypothetical protein
MSLPKMVTEINEARRHANLSSAIRLFVLKTESQEIAKCGGRTSLPRIGSLTGSFVAGIINAVIGAVLDDPRSIQCRCDLDETVLRIKELGDSTLAPS